jgi:uncharacterized protein YlaN (UPF0358 family)
MQDNDLEATRQAANAHFELVAVIRDNVFLPDWAVDELLDTQPDGTHAKQLLLALEIHGLIEPATAEVLMLRDGLGGE